MKKKKTSWFVVGDILLAKQKIDGMWKIYGVGIYIGNSIFWNVYDNLFNTTTGNYKTKCSFYSPEVDLALKNETPTYLHYRPKEIRRNNCVCYEVIRKK